MMLRLPKSWHTDATVARASALFGHAGAADQCGTIGFRLPRPPGETAPESSGSHASRQFTATLLLASQWELDIQAIAVTAVMRFPMIGRIGTIPAPSADAPGALTVDGAAVALRRLPGRVPPDRLSPLPGAMRAWDPESAIRGHVAAVEISCGGDLPGLEGAKAYAAAVHFVAAAACRVAPVSAVLWNEARAITEPGAFSGYAEGMLEGRMPLGAWVGCAAIASDCLRPGDATGLVTCGMRAFISRELEIAPCPGGPRHAWRCITSVAGMVLDRGLVLRDGLRLSETDGGFSVTVRERDLRGCDEQPSYLLLPDPALDLDLP